MATVEFRNKQDGQLIEQSGAARVEKIIRNWAERNEFDRVVLSRDGDKLWVQLGDEELNYWMPSHVLNDGREEELEMQLDYARGAQRRSAAGYGKFDK